MTPEQAAEKQRDYVDKRRAWAEEVGRPHPLRRTSKRKPEPGVIDLADDEVG